MDEALVRGTWLPLDTQHRMFGSGITASHTRQVARDVSAHPRRHLPRTATAVRRCYARDPPGPDTDTPPPLRLGTLPSGQSPPSPLYGTMSHSGYLRAGPLRDLSGLG